MTASRAGFHTSPPSQVTMVGDVYRRRTTCRGCGEARLAIVLELGPQPMANAFLASEAEAAKERRFPLDLAFCEQCALVQIPDVIAPEVLFSHYLYVSGTSETIAAHNRCHADHICAMLSLGPKDLVVEVASNDGSLLSCYRDRGVRTLGVEPAGNLAVLAQERGIETVSVFFDAERAKGIRAQFGSARAVFANNVLAHVDDPAGFLRGCRTLIDDDGLVVVEVPHALEMLERREYDTIYHEHLCYFSVTPLSRMAASAGLCVERIDKIPVHGGSIRAYLRPGRGDSPSIAPLLLAEAAAGVNTRAAWESFASASTRNAAQLRAMLAELRGQGASIAGYGAPAKGNTLLNFSRIGTDLLPYTVDRNPLKVGRLTPGMHIPVLPVETLAARRPDYVLVLAWNFAEEIMRQQEAHTASGGRWIIPVPSPRVQ